MVVEVDHPDRTLYAVAFHPDGIHFFGGTRDGIRRWRVADGQEVGNEMGMDIDAISVSRDGKWVVCGTMTGASVWDAELQRKVVEVEGTNRVRAVDVPPESTRFATATWSGKASIWSITGERLVGPLEHDSAIRESSSPRTADTSSLPANSPSASSTVTMVTSSSSSRTN